jgi:hypothetical protein
VQNKLACLSVPFPEPIEVFSVAGLEFSGKGEHITLSLRSKNTFDKFKFSLSVPVVTPDLRSTSRLSVVLVGAIIAMPTVSSPAVS